MTGHNREVAEVDLLIRKLQPAGPVRVAAIGSHPPSQVRLVEVPRRALAVRASVGLGVLLGIALPYWPYPRACGWWLLLYLLAVAMVIVAGMWGARLTWDSALGFTHVVALGTILWGVALAAHEVLTRVGYAKIQAAWFCQ